MVKHGFYDFLNWFDERAWYPLGRIVGGTVYPGLMITSGSIHYVLSLLNIPTNIRDVCVFLAPLFSGLTAISTYLLTKELWSQGAGLFAACFIAIVPGYISRSVAGSYDNEGIAIFALMFTYYLWIKAVKTGSVFWATWCALVYFYMVSAWGGYVFIINLIPLHVFVLILMNRFSQRIYVAYNTFFIVGLICSMQIPFVGFQPVKTSEHMAAAGVFALLQAHVNDERVFIILYAVSAVYFAGVMVRLMLTLTPCVCVLAAIAFSRLFELYLKEEQTTTNESETEDKNGRLYDKAGKIRRMRHEQPSSKEEGLGMNIRSIVVVAVLMMLMMFAVHCTWVTSNAYSSPSIVLASYRPDGGRNILDDFREAYYWLWQNTAEDATVMSWWDYGYQIAGMANRTTLVDNNTWNNSHIALVGKAMSSNETAAYEIMTNLNVDYVLVIFGGVIGYSGDDINKFLWMVRIAEGEHPNDIRESDYFTERGEFRVDSEGSPTLLNCLMYKLSYYRFGDLKFDYHTPAGFDRTRNAQIGNKDFDLTYLEEAYTSEHWLVRIYRVKKPDEFNRPRIPYNERKIKRRSSKSVSKKSSSKKKKGSIKHKPKVVKGQKPTK
eukprot:TCALIF_03018-PA protein Name:"Similar to STT3B Dolichyl-diphosphooligosaccharide--protein glycosyltransferase subunit STT3B (Homo sapiens)" AED:0.15 eAED:0.17 QI:0/0/0/0.87/1/0.87/8/0/605